MRLARAASWISLVGYGLCFAGAALGRGVPAFDDHPGQLYRLWHVVNHGWAPWTWNAGWWGGYPELQFYPPGFFWLGAALEAATFGLVPVDVVYRALVWLTYLAPGVTVLALLARVTGDVRSSLPCAFVALTLSAGLPSGVEGGVHVGMVPARLGWALLPLFALAVLARRRPAAAALLAAIVVVHPAHAPAAIALLTVSSAVTAPRRERALDALAITAAGAAMTAVWSLPLLMRLEEARALAWGTATAFTTAVRHPLLAAMAAAAALAVPLARTPTARAVAWWPWATFTLVAVDGAVLEPLGIRWLPADRVADGAWLAVVVAAGSTLGEISRRRAWRTAPAVAVTMAAILAIGVSGRTLIVWPRAAEWPDLAAMSRGLRLDALWAALRRAPAGRVLFVRSGVPLVFGTAWWRPHTHVTALAPIYAGRDIVNGTFTHPSPLAALVYRGDAGPGPITTLAERLDGRTLFGRDIAMLDVESFARYADRLGVGAVVVLDEDAPALARLLDGGAFSERVAAGPFVVLGRRAPPLPRSAGDGRRYVDVGGTPPTWIASGLAYYPLWRARRDRAEVPTRRGPFGDLELRVAGAAGRIELEYGPGTPERVGAFVTGVATAAVLGWALAERRRQPLRAAAPASAHS